MNTSNDIWLNQAFTPQALRYVKERYSLNRGQLDVLLCAQALQYTYGLPYFITGNIKLMMPRAQCVDKYKLNLISLGYISLTMSFPSPCKPNLFQVTGTGLAVLHSYSNKLRTLISAHKEFINNQY